MPARRRLAAYFALMLVGLHMPKDIFSAQLMLREVIDQFLEVTTTYAKED